jgi:uncharacterized repeat protein (TIGR03803 family)
MKRFYNVLALFCAFAFSCPAFSQEKIWYTSRALVNADTDGSNTQASAWANPEKYGSDPGFFMQASNGDIYVVNTDGGAIEDDMNGDYPYGAISRITKTGMQLILQLGYNQQTAFLTEGKNGYIYGARTSAFDTEIFRFRLDGSDYSYKWLPSYGMRASELTTTASGEIMGTTRYHLYQMKNDISGIVKVYEYQKATGNSPIGKLHYSSDGYLYGVTKLGGAGNYGVVYRVRPDGQEYTVLHQFNIANGRYPDRGLTEDTNGNLYGVTRQGGKYHKGVLFKIHKSGGSFEVLYHFTKESQMSYYDEEDLPASVQLTEDGTIVGEAPNQYHHNMFIFSLATKQYREPFPDNATISDIQVLREVSPQIEVLRPANGAVNVAVNDTYQVTNVPGAASYTAEFSTDPTFATDVLTTTYQSSGNLPRVNLAYNTKYYTRAKTSLWPYYGKVTSFTTRSAESFAFITNPKDGATGVEAPTLKITANQVSGAKRYVIEISTVADFSENVSHKESTSDYQRTMTFNDLSYNTKYYGRMKTEISDWGRVTSFTTKQEPVMLMTESVTLDVHPNPSTDYFHLATSASEDAQISVAKMTGEIFATHTLPAEGTLDVGSDYPKGIYIMRIMTSQGVVIKRLVKE